MLPNNNLKLGDFKLLLYTWTNNIIFTNLLFVDVY